MDPICGFCKRGALVEDICGNLRVETLDKGTQVAAHHKCMQYSAGLTQYKFEDFGGFEIKEVLLEIKRGRKLSCHICRSRKKDNKHYHPKTGATSGCAYAKCNKSFHFYCANVDDTVITERLVDTFKKRQTVLYRVYCSESHRRSFIEELLSKKEKLLGHSDSSDDSDDEKLPEYLASKVGKPISKRARELQSLHSKSKKSRRDKEEKKSLPKELSPVERLSLANRECTPSPVSSEFCGSTMSNDTSSIGMGTPNPESKHQFILPEVDLSERLPNVPDDSEKLLGHSDSSDDSDDEKLPEYLASKVSKPISKRARELQSSHSKSKKSRRDKEEKKSLPKELSPVGRLSSANRDCTPSPVASEFSGSTMSNDTSSNGMGTPNPESKHQFIFPEEDLSERLPNVPDDSEKLLGHSDSSDDSDDEKLPEYLASKVGKPISKRARELQSSHSKSKKSRRDKAEKKSLPKELSPVEMLSSANRDCTPSPVASEFSGSTMSNDTSSNGMGTPNPESKHQFIFPEVDLSERLPNVPDDSEKLLGHSDSSDDNDDEKLPEYLASKVGKPISKRARELQSSHSKSKKSRRDKAEKKSLPKELSPVEMLSSANRDCTPSPVASEFSGSTMSNDTSSNGMGTPNPESKHQFIFPEVDLSERLPNVPDDSEKLLGHSDSSDDSDDEKLPEYLASKVGKPISKRARELQSSHSKSKKSRRDKAEKKSLPKELSPVEMLSSANRDCTPSPVASEFSGSTMSNDTSSNGMGTPNPESKHQFIFPEVDLSERLPNVPDDSVALCILSDLKSSSETWEELYHILETRYGINQDSVYLWHRVIKKHGMLSEHVLHFIADVTKNLVDVELERFVQWLLCPSAMALQQKYKKIVDFQEKLGGSIKQKLDHGISKTIFKNVRRTCRALSWPISEIIQLGDGYALIILITPKLGGTQELVSLFPSGQSQSWSSSSQMLFSISLNYVQIVSRNLQSTKPTNLQREILTLKRWCIGEIKAPIQIEVRPVTVEKDILCPEESKDNHRLIPQISSFLSKIFTSSIAEGPRTEVLCILDLDSQVVKPELYIRSVLAKFMSKSTGKCYMFIDVQSVYLDMLFYFLKILEEASEKRLEILSLVDISKVSPTVIVIRASNSSVRETPPSSPDPVHSLKRGGKLEDDSKEGGNKSSTKCPSDDNKKSSEQEEDETNGNNGEDGEIPSTSVTVENKLKLRCTGSGNWKTKNSNKRPRSNVN